MRTVGEILNTILESVTLRDLAVQVVNLKKGLLIESPLTDFVGLLEAEGYPSGVSTWLAVDAVQYACLQTVVVYSIDIDGKRE